MDIEALDTLLHGVRHVSGDGQRDARCPAHDDHRQSLRYAPGKMGAILVKCQAGCETTTVLAALNLTMGDIQGEPYIEAEYPYYDADGVEVYRVIKWQNPKDFRCSPGLPVPALRVPYNLPLVKLAIERNRVIYHAEGEKDCETFASVGEVATTNVTGAGKTLHPSYFEYFRGAHLVIVADRDAPGVAHARNIAAGVRDLAASVQLVVPRYGKDFTDLVTAGYGITELDPMPESDGIGVTRSTNVTTKKVSWAWGNYIAFGKVTGLDGDPGVSKSTVTIDLAARWSTTLTMPDGSTHNGPYNVLMVTAEDDVADTIVPRLKVAGADLNRVFLVDHGGDESRPFDIGLDGDELYRLVQQFDIKVVILDPLMAMIGAKTDAHTDASVRQALYPLYRLARDLGVAVIVVRHFNKAQGSKAIYRGGGSIGFTGAARAVYTVGFDPEDSSRRIFANIKMNLAAAPPSLGFEVKTQNELPYLQWLGPVDIGAQEVVDGVAIDREEADAIVEFLNVVVENGEPITWHEIVLKGKREGYSEKQLRVRRKASRLVKILGTEGNRSVRWGYLEHQLASIAAAGMATTEGDEAAPSEPHLPIRPENPSKDFQGTWADGNDDLTDSDGLYPDGTTDEMRDRQLRALPLRCSECGSEDATRWLKPFWVIRCDDHNPRTYGHL